jgi:hypothetical protein
MKFSIPRRLIAVSITAGVLLLAPATALAWDGRGDSGSTLTLGGLQLGTTGGSLVHVDSRGDRGDGGSLTLGGLQLSTTGGSLVHTDSRGDRGDGGSLTLGGLQLGTTGDPLVRSEGSGDRSYVGSTPS